MNGCKRLGLISRHQGAVAHIGSADATGYRSDDPGVAKVDTGRFNHGLVVSNIGLGLFQRSRRVVVVLLTDRLFGKQLPVAVGPQTDCGQIRLGPAKGGFCIVERRLKRGRIELVQNFACLDFGTFRKQTLQDQPVDLGTDFGSAVGRCAARQLRGQNYPLRCYRHKCHLRRPRRLGCFRLAVASRQQ